MSIEKSIVFNFHVKQQPKPEEGGTCPSCCEGVLKWYSDNCSCHLVAPCGSCENAPLRCVACFEEFRL